jgi:hypothetical protein
VWDKNFKKGGFSMPKAKILENIEKIKNSAIKVDN